MTWRIHAVDGMPTNISVGHPALSIMQSIPWLPRNVVQTLLEVRCFPVHSLQGFPERRFTRAGLLITLGVLIGGEIDARKILGHVDGCVGLKYLTGRPLS